MAVFDNEITQQVSAFKYVEILISLDVKTGFLKEKGSKDRNFNDT
jgi:hypothetical protein